MTRREEAEEAATHLHPLGSQLSPNGSMALKADYLAALAVVDAVDYCSDSGGRLDWCRCPKCQALDAYHAGQQSDTMGTEGKDE